MKHLWRNSSAFSIALVISVLMHAVVLSIRFINPEAFNRMFSDMPLEVILVNAQTHEKPANAQTIAQVAMVGGGEASQGRSSSPLPYAASTSLGNDVVDQERKEASTRERQNNMLSQLRKQIADLPELDPRKTNHSQAELAQEQKRQYLLRLLAEIEKDVKTENERPRKRFVSPSTQDSVAALYLNNVRAVIAQKGTTNFPTVNGKPLLGTLIMEVLINHDGALISAEVIHSSGNPALDRRAMAIVASSAPFGVFNRDMRKTMDQLGFISSFEFRQDGTTRLQMREQTTAPQ